MVLSALGFSWTAFECSRGALGGLLGSSGVLLGPLRGLLGCSEELLGACWGRLGASWGLLAALLASYLVHVFFEIVVFSSSKLLGTSLVSTADLPRRKNKVLSVLAS